MISKLFKGVLVGLSLLFLSSCGESVCVMGMGHCDAPDKPANMSLVANPTSVQVNGTSTITVSGGTSPYKFGRYNGLGSISNENIFTSATTTTFTAPANINGGTSAIIEVTDSSSPPSTVRTTITITN
jgi:hypothetical protein